MPRLLDMVEQPCVVVTGGAEPRRALYLSKGLECYVFKGQHDGKIDWVAVPNDISDRLVGQNPEVCPVFLDNKHRETFTPWPPAGDVAAIRAWFV